MTLFNMAHHIFKRFKHEPNLDFMSKFTDFCDGVGKYSDENMGLAMWKAKFEVVFDRFECITLC